MTHQDYLLDGVLDGKSTDFISQRTQLIRILSRSGTLPKVANLQVQYIHSQPEMFLMEPGKQLRIGVRLLAKPVLALVALRYGIEWQIWYKSIKKYSQDYRICDLAAAVAAGKFIALLPEDDRKEFESEFPDDISSILRAMSAVNFEATQINAASFKDLNKFHRLKSPDTPLDPALVHIVSQLAIPTETLMMSGGDLRLNVDSKQLLNVYGCRPFPRPEAFTFASSTATSVSNIAFDYTQKQREKLIAESIVNGIGATYRAHQTDLLERLKISLRLGRKSEIIISPSGTDISLLFAGMCQSLYQKTIVHILVASDETGSGVALALSGKHFANTSALNKPTVKEAAIAGFEPATVIKIPLRDAHGAVKTKELLDLEVATAIDQALAAHNQPVLHVMDQSKLGYAAPTQDFLDLLQEKYGNEVLVLVDNSQLRMPIARLESYLKRGFLVTLTGSKFYTGPPFSGALILPEAFANRVKEANKPLPKGLCEYYLKTEFIADAPMGEVLSEGTNIGSLLRWYAALAEIERYYRIPITLRTLGTEVFCEHVQKRIESTPFLENLEKFPAAASVPLSAELRTIYPFFILKEGKVLSHEDADKLYRLLNEDISEHIEYQSDIEKRIAKQVCHIGQPVKVLYHNQQASAVLRISLGSRALSESWKDRDVSIFFQRMEAQMNQVDIVVSKIGLILKYNKELFGGEI